VDGVNFLILPDLSTRLAALRTGKLDMMSGVTWEDAAFTKKTTPKLMHRKTAGYTQGMIGMRISKPPFNDIRVRRALMMAIDYEEIVNSLYGGEGQIVTYPISYYKEYGDAFLGLDDPEMPASVKELYVYNPEKARQLLTEAGYPDGFKTTLMLPSTPANIDYLSIIKDMWFKVGIDVELDVKESGVFSSLRFDRNYENMINSSCGPVTTLYTGENLRGDAWVNISYVDDPIVNEASDEVQRTFLVDRDEAHRIYKELMKYVLDQAWVIPGTKSYSYIFWWPWLKNYSGETTIGYYNSPNWIQYIWLDQDLKKSMGY